MAHFNFKFVLLGTALKLDKSYSVLRFVSYIDIIMQGNVSLDHWIGLGKDFIKRFYKTIFADSRILYFHFNATLIIQQAEPWSAVSTVEFREQCSVPPVIFHGIYDIFFCPNFFNFLRHKIVGHKSK